MSAAGRAGLGFLYVSFGLTVLAGGWLLGSLYETAREAPMAILGEVLWFFGLILSAPLLVASFVARPTRRHARFAWTAAVAAGFVGFFRVWSWPWIVAALAASATLLLPHRSTSPEA
jgi:hypothetical protein